MKQSRRKRGDVGREPEAAQTTLFQLDVWFDGAPQERSDWGAVKVRYRPARHLQYFNLAVGGRWIVRNAPLFPARASQPIETFYYFALGVTSGVGVGSLFAAASIASEPARTPPRLELPTIMLPRTESYWTNFHEEPYQPLGAPPDVYPGGPFDQVLFCRTDYPNQLCGKNECAPAAVSNSIQWLDKTYGLKIDPKKLSIKYWRAALNWKGDGVDHGAWAHAKTRFVDNPDNKLPIDSETEGGGHGKQVLAEFKRGQAVEVDIGPHTSAVTCMGVDADGNFHLMCASDALQNGNAQGAVTQQVVISPNGEVISGPPQWARGQHVHNFVIQCPHKDKFGN
jgi:hypothetical protein